MANILEFYMNTFVPSYQNNDDNKVDISNLIEASHNWSPVVLEYADKKQFEKQLTAAILVNFCKNYTQTTLFPKKAIIALTSILQKTSTDSVAQRTFLLHLTKIKNNVDWACFYFCQVENMRVKRVTSEDEIEWKQLATKLIQHEQIQNIIKESIAEFDLPIPADIKIENIEITLVENVTTVVRGFSGFDEIFINANHFRRKLDSFEGDINLLQLLAKMDTISLTLNEFAHVMIRKCAKNFNMSTPVLAHLKGLQPNRFEFGRYNEIRIFNKQVDWFLSHTTIDVSYIERFITSIESGHKLPTGFVEGALERVHHSGFGMDLQLPFYLC